MATLRVHWSVQDAFWWDPETQEEVSHDDAAPTAELLDRWAEAGRLEQRIYESDIKTLTRDDFRLLRTTSSQAAKAPIPPASSASKPIPSTSFVSKPITSTSSASKLSPRPLDCSRWLRHHRVGCGLSLRSGRGYQEGAGAVPTLT